MGSKSVEKNSATICLIVRDEAPYILEWIAHYKSLGVQDFIVFDHLSTDKTSNLLSALAKSGVIQHFEISDAKGAQRKAYSRAVKHCNTEWLGYLDIDEFVKLETHQSIPDLLSGFEEKVASVSLVWKSFGSSGKYLFSREPVTTRFTQRGVDLDFGNMWTKYFVRVKSLLKPEIHFCHAKIGTKHVLANGSPRTFFGANLVMPNHEVACIHHYPIKAHEEALYKTKVRGQFGARTDKYSEIYMKSHDVNDVEDLSLAVRWHEVRKQLHDLAKLSQKDDWNQLFNDYAPTQPLVIAKQQRWHFRDATLLQDAKVVQAANLDWVVISNHESAVPGIATIAVQLGLKVSGSAPNFIDSQLQIALASGDWNQAAKRVKQLLQNKTQLLNIVIDSQIADQTTNQDLFRKLGLKPKGVIALLRDPLATVIKSNEGEPKLAHAPSGSSVAASLAAYAEAVRQVECSKAPKLWISAEGLLQNHGALISKLADHFGVSLNPLEFQALKFAVTDDLGLRLGWNSVISGAVEQLGEGWVKGWAKWANKKLAAVELQVLVNFQPVAKLTANVRRLDLAKTGQGDCGFEYQLPEWVKPSDVVSVQVLGKKYQLDNSPSVYLG